MSIYHTYLFEELDDQSREYLLCARDKAGQGMPGIFVRRQNALPAIAFVSGVAILGGMAVLSWYLMQQEPLAIAMLQTIGVLLGGWLILYAVRIWNAQQGSRYAGYFVFADAHTLWDCRGTTVTTTELSHLVEAKGVLHFNTEKKYTHTVVTVKADNGVRSFDIQNERHARDLIHFLNALVWLRSREGSENGGIDLSQLSPAIEGAVAKTLTLTDELPTAYTAEALELEVTELPTPRKEGRASSGVLMYALIVLVAVGGVFGFKHLNVGQRDDAIWASIMKFEEPHKHEAAPWLRAYLADPRNIAHREEARAMLRDIYQKAIASIRAKVNPAGIANQGEREPVDPALVDCLAIVLTELAEQPQAVVTVSVKDGKPGSANASEREKDVRREYTLALMNAVSPQLVAFVEAPPEALGMIDIVFVEKDLPNNFFQKQVNYKVTVRQTTDGEPKKSASKTIVDFGNNSLFFLAKSASRLGQQTAGPKKINLEQLDEI